MSVNNMAVENAVEDDEVSLFELWDTLRQGGRTILGVTALGALGAAGFLAMTPNKYEALALVQVGQVGQVGQVISLPVEAPVLAVERMKSSTFQAAVATELGDQDWLRRLAASDSSDRLAVQLVKSTAASGGGSLIELRARANSREGAERSVLVAVEQLAKRHAEIAQPTVDRLQSDLAVAKEKLGGAEKELSTLLKSTASAAVRDERFTQLALMTSLRVSKETEIYSQRQIVTATQTALAPPMTQAAMVIEAPFVPEKPVSPKPGLLYALGVLGGAVFGSLLVFARAAFARARSSRQAPG